VLFLCCHPALSPPSQVALTLRAAGGLTTGEIARAFLVPDASMAKRITRAKQSIKDSGTGFRTPSAAEQPARLAAVLRVLYLIFNEGYTATSGAEPVRIELSGEAGIRVQLGRELDQRRPGAVEGLQDNRVPPGVQGRDLVVADLVGDDGARRHYLDAARRTLSLPERDYLRARAARLTRWGPAGPPASR
jgi:hypothetical protein